MPDFPYRTALMVGAGPGISGSLARLLAHSAAFAMGKFALRSLAQS
jgi:hypothetical protein